MVFPGGYCGGDDPHAAPLATVLRRAIEQAGAVVEPVMYDDLLDRDRFLTGHCVETAVRDKFFRADQDRDWPSAEA